MGSALIALALVELGIGGFGLKYGPAAIVKLARAARAREQGIRERRRVDPEYDRRLRAIETDTHFRVMMEL